ncbi:hypothetical protein E1B28_008381 [Marasmius oreades]|uniref:Glycosyltransferase family 20 protein n=1 Tax=Marasmius oreades TaxID=181124 RepID=A0A9P7RYF2_9AGAR|nr:uncharacterized protein E1B28_008381 [Marasmius oreades]KAG7091994.1 hypothetical protein E1B28_008381 [Marasmius oreades]
MATASSLRNHRIVIASLFLPQTVILGSPDDYSPSREPPSSPNDHEDSLNISEVSSKLQDKAWPKQTPLSPSLGTTAPKTPYLSGLNKPALLKSIVDDLKDRATAALPSPTTENLNPFFVISPAPLSRNVSTIGKPSGGGQSTKPSSGNTGGGTIGASSTPGSHNRPTSSSSGPPSASATHIQRSLSRRMRKQGSRSSSRRPGLPSSKGGDQSSTGLLIEHEKYENTFYFEASSRCNGGLKNALDSVSREPPSPLPSRPVRTGHSRANSLQSLSKLKEKVSVGTLGVETDGFTEGLKRNIDERLRKEHGCEAVWVADDEFEGCYDEFCHQVLWPALHYVVPDAPKTKMFYESASYKQYVAVNKAFAEKIAEVWQEGDVVWVNDYHLMLLPLMLRSSGLIPSNAPIGFFLHAAFPSSEIFRCLSVRAALLRGVLGADLVGFQTANHARHFRQTCSRILSVESLPRGIQLGSSSYNASSYPSPPPFTRSVSSSSNLSDSAKGSLEKEDRASDLLIDHLSSAASFAALSASMGEHGKGRFVDVGVFPMGIDVNQLNEKRKDPEVAEWVDILKQRYNGMRLVVGRDKMDGVQGVRQKIQAFERFLEFYASKDEALKEKVVLIQIAMPPSSGQADEDILSSILTTVSHINSRFSTLTYQPVVLLHSQEVSFSQYLALLRAADAFLVTSLREGMALRTHEFVVCQEGKEKEGSLILSEFTGSYSYSGFRSCIAINPWDIRGTAAAIHQGLTMSPEESHSRWEDLQGHVMGQNAQAFVIGFLTRCLRAAQEGDTTEDDGVEENRVLNVKGLVGMWKHCKTRLVVVDWEDGLISSYASFDSSSSAGEREKEKEKVENAAVEVLRTLVKDSRNEVWLLSGYPRKELEKVSQEVGGRLGIVAENGCFIKTRNTKGQEGEWISMVASLNLTWKNICSEMLNYFTERTPGAYVEEREASVVWRFWSPQELDDRRPDCLWARRQAAEAQNHVFDSLGERFGLRIIPSSNSFLVLPNNISWSTAVGSILLGLYGGGNEWDIVVALSGDERLLRRLGELDNSETVSTSGKGSTDAKWRLVRDIRQGEESDVVKVLREFAEC